MRVSSYYPLRGFSQRFDKAHKKAISHASQRKAWEEAPDYTPSPSSQQRSPEIKALRSAQT
eukprot:743411-Hanusia_phi.AAC.1